MQQYMVCTTCTMPIIATYDAICESLARDEQRFVRHGMSEYLRTTTLEDGTTDHDTHFIDGPGTAAYTANLEADRVVATEASRRAAAADFAALGGPRHYQTMKDRMTAHGVVRACCRVAVLTALERAPLLNGFSIQPPFITFKHLRERQCNSHVVVSSCTNQDTDHVAKRVNHVRHQLADMALTPVIMGT
jgi:hypothetical protein